MAELRSAGISGFPLALLLRAMDLGLLIDFLRGELDAESAARVRLRLENEPEFFAKFERLRRTLALVRSLPPLQASQFNPPAPSPTAEFPLVQPREQYVADLRREYAARGWAAFIPQILVASAFSATLRSEFSVRSLLISLPWLNARSDFVSALRAEFSARALCASLPEISARPQFIRALSNEFGVRALCSSLPLIAVREAFARRVKVALYEAGREVPAEGEPVRVASGLPMIEPSDPFRRRVFMAIRNFAKRPLRQRPVRALALVSFNTGREMLQRIRKSKSLGYTFGAHVLAIVCALFITAQVAVSEPSPYNISMGGGIALPPGGPTDINRDNVEVGEAPARLGGEEDPRLNARTEAPEGGGAEDPSIPPIEAPSEDVQVAPPVKPVSPNGLGGGSGTTATLAMFRLRGEGKSKKIGYLGSNDLYETLSRSLNYLSKNQRQSGNWDIDVDNADTVPRGESSRRIIELELTASAALAFLGDGHSSKKSELGYESNVKRAISWILAQQQPDGQIGPGDLQVVLCHTIGLMALIEEFALTGRNDLRVPIRKGCRWLCDSRAADAPGAFPYGRNQVPSLMTSVWAYMTLETARAAKVPESDAPVSRMEEVLQWFDSEFRKDELKYQIDDANDSDLMPNAAALALTYFPRDGGYDNRRIQFRSRIEGKSPDLAPRAGRSADATCDMRYLFFGSLAHALARPRGSRSTAWETSCANTLIKHQIKEGPKAGTYELTGYYASLYGRAYEAAMAALTIENAYRVDLLR